METVLWIALLARGEGEAYGDDVELLLAYLV